MAINDQIKINQYAPHLPSDPENYHFFQLVELLYLMQHADLEKGLDATLNEEPIRYISNASLAFPKSDVSKLRKNPNQKQITLETTFLGLTGSQSPLPNYYTEAMAWEYCQENKQLSAFLDLFNHRLLSALHRIWRKYRYYINFKKGGTDTLSQRMFALVGLGQANTRDSLHIDKSKMLAYSGLLASASRSPQILTTLISHCFDLQDVSIKSWEFRRVPISEEQQNRLGKKNCSSGLNMFIGSSIPDRTGKFTLEINGLSLEHFLTFLPNCDNYKRIETFMAFILRKPLAWDLKLGLAEKQVGGIRLGYEKLSQLGWTTFIGTPPEEPFITLAVQE